MKSRQLVGLQVFLWLICAFHVIVGVGLNVSSEFPQFLAQYYGAQVNWTPELRYLVKPVGAFMLALGVLAGVAARNPLGYPSIVYGFVLLFVVRGLQRLIFQGEIETALDIASGRNLGNAVFFLLMAAGLMLLLRFARQQTNSNS
jgi:hypothetical protein